MKKQTFFNLILVFLLYSNLFSQECQISRDDSTGVTTRIFEDGSKLSYASHELMFRIDTVLRNDPNHIYELNDFLYSFNSRIAFFNPDNPPLNTSNGTGIILLYDTMDAFEYIDIFIQSGLFINVELNHAGELNDIFFNPNDPRFNEQWYLKQSSNKDIDAEKAWTITKGDSSKVRIYVIDSGIKLFGASIYHEDLIDVNHIKIGKNFTVSPANNIIQDSTTSGHGTRVAGLLGAVHNSVGIAGIAPRCEIIVHKVTRTTSGTPFANATISAINDATMWKISNPSRNVVVNLSLAFSNHNNELRIAIESARQYKVICVCGAGNDTGFVSYPARYDSSFANVISVGATKRDDYVAIYSNSAPQGTTFLTLVAPGGDGSNTNSENLISTTNAAYAGSTAYNYRSGTSFATPLVTGTVALMFCVNDTMTATRVKSVLTSTCEKVPGMNGSNYTIRYGYGRLNSYRAVVKSLVPISGILSTNNYTIPDSRRVVSGNPLTISQNTRVVITKGKVLVLDDNATLFLNPYSKLVVLGTLILRNGSLTTGTGEIIDSGCVINQGNLFNLSNNGGNDRGCIAVFNGVFSIDDDMTLNYDAGGFMAMKYGGKIVLGENSNIVFSGNGYMEALYKGGNILFGNNSGIKFKEQSYLITGSEDTSKIRFSALNNLDLWNGIEFENSIASDSNNKIRDCIFSQAKTAITINNNQASAFVNRIIKNCTFNIPSGGNHKGIYGENNYSILVDGNRFNMPTSPGGSPFYTGLYLKNVTPSSPPEAAGEEGATATPYSLNIVNNTFRNGSSGIVLANYTSNLLPYYIKGNRFDSLDAHAAMVNIIGMKITGTIKDNVLSSSQSPIGIHLINSSPNLLNNVIVARDVSLHLVGSSYANLAPNIYNNQAYWSGGRNTLSSYLYDNIQLAYMGNAYTDYGRNKFTVSNDSAYHIYGWLDTNVLRYHSRDNCWYTSGAAKIYLRHPGETMPVPSTTYNYGINCNSSPGPISWEVDNLGNGIFDSVLVSEDVSDSLPTEEEILIAQCEHYLNEMQMFGEAMISLKYYIDDYPEGEYTNDALMNLYTAYLYLDTSANQNNRNILFGNLINYCEDKVASNLYDTQFEYLAGDVIAMCNFELDNYDDAMNWYEFIALFYPDPDIRLSASWNYAEIEALIGSGTGGGEVELGIKNYELGMKSDHAKLELNRLFKAAQDDPVMRKLFRKFELQNKKMSGNDMQATNGNKQHEAESEMQDSKLSEADMLIYDKAKKNIFRAGQLQGKEAESDRMRDIVLMLPGARILGKTVSSNVLPSEFALRQNYPNPFNPVTNIEYDLPVDGNIELKIYDIAGRLMKTLVNEFKTAGSYLVSFNASDLSSGVYFYSMNVDGIQIGVKRMTLVK